MTTLKDISRYTNISQTQVSRALNDHDDVSSRTKEIVKAAAEHLGYSRNRAAKLLATGQSEAVALILHGMPRRELSWLFMQMIGTLSKEFARHGYHFLFHVADRDSSELELYKTLVKNRSIDGFVIVDPKDSDHRIDYLSDVNIPFVVHGRSIDRSDYPYFDIDNQMIGYQLTKHLLEKGHRRIGFINGRSNASFSTRRKMGHIDALNEFNVPFDQDLYFSGHMSEANGRIQSIKMLALQKEPPTAFIASNTRIANGVWKAADALGVKIPQDLSLVCHDDHLGEVDAENTPLPTTATDSPFGEAWAPIADYLVGRIRGNKLNSLQKIDQCQFIERETVNKI